MLHTAFWVVIFVLALSFFGISIQAIVNSPAGQENFAYIGHLLSDLWQWLVAVAHHLEVWNWW